MNEAHRGSQLGIAGRMYAPENDMQRKQRFEREASAQAAALRARLGVRVGVARNWPCPCGSGKKLKLCCGK